MTNYRQIFTRRAVEYKKLQAKGYDIPETSGIYSFYRYDTELKKRCIYIGKAKNLRQRICDHIIQYKQHIDKSIKKYGIAENGSDGSGWKIKYKTYEEDMLNDMEQFFIQTYSTDDDYILYNIESGGTTGKVLINDRKEPKGYQQGLKQGYLNCQRYVRELFKYLKVSPNQFKNNAMPTQLAIRKQKEFEDFLKGETKENDK